LPPTDSGCFTAVVLEMILESGSYATMLLRELTKSQLDKISQQELQQTLDQPGTGQFDEHEREIEDEREIELGSEDRLDQDNSSFQTG